QCSTSPIFCLLLLMAIVADLFKNLNNKNSRSIKGVIDQASSKYHYLKKRTINRLIVRICCSIQVFYAMI
ncbi:hypothetical protein, partial [Psychrobacter sp.]|uniref:hypothetical protein n=1 Tax=Psychrobacter sp. TaxID=56811 RepID=UPI00264766AC